MKIIVASRNFANATDDTKMTNNADYRIIPRTNSVITLTASLGKCCQRYVTKRLIFLADVLIAVTLISHCIVACLVYFTIMLQSKGNELRKVWNVEVGPILKCYSGNGLREFRKSMENMSQIGQYPVQALNSWWNTEQSLYARRCNIFCQSYPSSLSREDILHSSISVLPEAVHFLLQLTIIPQRKQNLRSLTHTYGGGTFKILLIYT
jgi:hypothetical protein